MSGFFDRIFKKSEVKTEKRLRFDEIPGYLDLKGAEINSRIESAAKDARTSALSGINEIQNKISELEKVGPDDIKHPNPKVGHVALKSKKNFIDSMEKTLSVELPEDPDQLYNALVELIRSIANNMRRQGKYLHPAFPDEMKEIKSSLDIIGRALNTMTEDFKPSVELREKVNKAKENYGKISAIADEIRSIEAKAQHLEEKCESLEKSTVNLERERKEIMSSGDYLEYESIIKELESLEEKKSEVSGRYGSLLVTCDNVLRKVAYAAEKNGDQDCSEKLNYLVMLLHSGEKKDSSEASELYRRLYPCISRTISENETIIKNKHESQLFSSANLFISQLDEICSAYSNNLSEIESAKVKLSALGMNEKIFEIGHRVDNNDAEIEKIGEELSAGRSKKQSLEDSVPGMVECLKGLLAEIYGGEVFIEDSWDDAFLK